MNTVSLENILKTLGAIPHGKSSPTVAGGAKPFTSSTKYIAGIATNLNAANGNLITPNLVTEVGVTNFPKGNSLPKGTGWLITGIRMLFDTTATADASVKANVYRNLPPANFKNGELTISQGGRLFDSPISDVNNEKASTSNDDDFREIVPIFIRSETPWQIQVALAGVAVANQAYKLELRVVEFTDHDKQ